MAFNEVPLNGDIVYRFDEGLPLPPLYSREMIEDALKKVGEEPTSFSFAEEAMYLEARHPHLRISIELKTNLLGWYANVRTPKSLGDRGRQIAEELWKHFQDKAIDMYHKDREAYNYFPSAYEFFAEEI